MGNFFNSHCYFASINIFIVIYSKVLGHNGMLDPSCNGFIVTNYHCIKDGIQFVIDFPQSRLGIPSLTLEFENVPGCGFTDVHEKDWIFSDDVHGDPSQDLLQNFDVAILPVVLSRKFAATDISDDFSPSILPRLKIGDRLEAQGFPTVKSILNHLSGYANTHQGIFWRTPNEADIFLVKLLQLVQGASGSPVYTADSFQTKHSQRCRAILGVNTLVQIDASGNEIQGVISWDRIRTHLLKDFAPRLCIVRYLPNQQQSRNYSREKLQRVRTSTAD